MKMLSLFSGIGGIDLAAEWAGIKTVAFCEIDPFCQKVLKTHWSEVPIYSDVRDITKEGLENAGITGIDIVAGGFPCQDLSVGGNKKGLIDEDGNITRSGLWFEMFRVIREIRPAWVVTENVRGAVNLALDTVTNCLKSENYQVRSIVLPACAVGAPHRRERLFVVANSTGIRLQDGDKYIRLVPKNIKSKPRTWNGELLVKPSIQRVVDGLPSKLDKDRLKVCGNAVVPQQILPIFQVIQALSVG